MQFLTNIRNSRGFTLIELLVVITIIGILATGGTVTYTSQIQKARDMTRISDVKWLQSAIEQYYQDKSNYPSASGSSFTGASSVKLYIQKYPKDPKSGQSCNTGGGGTASGSACDYIYNASDDSTNGIALGEYKISTAFENKGNVDSKAANLSDGGNEAVRLELGINLTNAKLVQCNRPTSYSTPPTTLSYVTTTSCSTTDAWTWGTPIYISGN